MNASEAGKNLVEMYRNEVSGISELIEIPELGIEFYIFPAQSEEVAFMYKKGIEEIQFDRNYASRMICARAKNADTSSWLDNDSEKEIFYSMLTTKAPGGWTDAVARRVISQIESVFPTTSVEEAGNDSGSATSSDSTST